MTRCANDRERSTCFNPYWVSNPLQLIERRGPFSSFPIPVGFYNRCGSQLARPDAAPSSVSIPIGFSNPLPSGGDRKWVRHPRFQSLLGFLIRCNQKTYTRPLPSDLVSIPIGFSIRCNLADHGPGQDGLHGFNPYWVSNHCNPTYGLTATETDPSFQSLLGFQSAATGDEHLRGSRLYWFQSYWVSNPLQRPGVAPDPGPVVSIPIGFSNPLQPSHPAADKRPLRGFNPYWVF